MMFAFLAWLIIKKFILLICILFKKFRWACYIGRFVFEEDFGHTYKIYQIKILIEAYIDFTIMSFLNINSWRIYPKLHFWSSPWDLFSSIGTIMSTLFVVIYPIYGGIAIHQNLDRLDDSNVERNLGILYEDKKHRNLHQALFNVYGMFRKLLMVTVFVCLDEYPYF
jgi:hypothetical protein